LGLIPSVSGHIQSSLLAFTRSPFHTKRRGRGNHIGVEGMVTVGDEAGMRERERERERER